jgi:hypothetical protein
MKIATRENISVSFYVFLSLIHFKLSGALMLDNISEYLTKNVHGAEYDKLKLATYKFFSKGKIGLPVVVLHSTF